MLREMLPYSEEVITNLYQYIWKQTKDQEALTTLFIPLDINRICTRSNVQ